ncbi:MAG: hypothetical protein IAF38_09000 [Bacteroidia bacterium]|nr:hypothetical protein [Bacteroidia bacterium]
MKNIFLGIISALLIAFCSCSSTTTNYVISDKNSLSFCHGGTDSIVRDLTPSYFDLSSDELIPVYFIYSEPLPFAEKLISINIKLFAKDENTNEYTQEIPLSSSQLKAEYFDGKSGKTISKKDFKENLFTLVGPEMKDYKYRDSRYVTFTFDNKYSAEDYPETLKQIITLKWTDKEKTFSNILTKTKSSKSFISGRPFG